MKLTLELDTAAGEAGMRAALDVLSRVYGTSPLAAVPGAPAGGGGMPAVAPAPLPQTPPAAPSIPSAMPAPGAPPASPMPPPPAPGGSAAPPPSPAPAAAPPAPPPASPGGITQAQFSQQVNAFATKYGAKATKQRFGEMAAAYGQAGWTSTNAVPADQYDTVIDWFKTE